MLKTLATQAAKRLIAQKASEMMAPSVQMARSSAIGGTKRRGRIPTRQGYQTSLAPAAVGSVQQGPKFTFKSITRNGMQGIQFMFNTVWCAITTQAAGNTVLISQGGAGVTSLEFDPDNTTQLPTPVTNFVRNFTRWALENLQLDYLAACPSSTAGEIAFGWDTDPGDSVPAASNPTAVMLLANSMGGAPWANMTMKVPVDNQLRYVYNSVAYASLTVPELRQISAGSLVGASTGVAASTLLGWLRIRATISVFELNPTAIQSTLLDVRSVDLCSSCAALACASQPGLVRGFKTRDRVRELLAIGPAKLRRTDAQDEEKKEAAAPEDAQTLALPSPTTAVPLLATAAGVSVPSGWTLVKSPDQRKGDRLTMPASLLSYRD